MPPLRPVFVLFGDSITQRSFSAGGWGAALADRYARRADVVNRGFSGYNTTLAMHLLPHVFPQGGEAPALIAVFLGANDAALPERMSRRQHCALPDFTRNLRSIAAHVASAYAGAARPPQLLFITPPPVHDAARVMHGVTRWGAEFDGQAERTNSNTARYAAAVAAVAAELKVPCVDAWAALQADTDWRKTHLEDGLHLAPPGSAALFAALTDVIDTQLPHLAPDALPFDFPEWYAVDAKEPAKSFAR